MYFETKQIQLRDMASSLGPLIVIDNTEYPKARWDFSDGAREAALWYGADKATCQARLSVDQ